MGKEAKIGLAVVGTLAIVFCGVLYKRVNKLKATPAAVAKSDTKTAEESKLFGSAKKLSSLAAKKSDDPDSMPVSDKSTGWNSESLQDKSTKSADAAPPRGSYLPTNDKVATDPSDRYLSRAQQLRDPVSETATANDESVSDEIASDEPAEPKPTSAPIAISNPFARSKPATEAVEVADEPSEAEDSGSLGEVADDESSAPAHLAEDTVPAATLTAASSEEMPSRPSNRFSASSEDEPRETPSARYGNSMPRTPHAEQGRSTHAIAGGKYKLGPNENFWTVSEKAYGTGGYFKALHAYNAEAHPIADDLTVGDEVAVPMKSELERQFPGLCPKPGRRPAIKSYAIQASAKIQADSSTYVVQEGDTLFDIARYELGKASRWAELYDLNRDVIGEDIDFLRAGMELTLPDDHGKVDSVTRQPGSAVQR